jgi:hypothetical protein
MSTNKVFCLGDGYAHGHLWPEWPQILQAVVENQEVIVISGIGAGNEFLIHKLLQHDIKNQTVIFQWASHKRFDKIIEDDSWKVIAKNDEIYHFNLYQSGNDLWWLSSASENHHVRLYHDFYVQEQQALARLQDQKKLLQGYLANQGCRYIEISTLQEEIFSRQEKFRITRGSEVQPSPMVHYSFLMEEILPKSNISYDPKRADKLRQLIENFNWKPYDPDRKEIWNRMVNDLNID